MVLKSPYPELPPLPDANVHHFFFNRPDQAEWPEDYTYLIDSRTGRKRSFVEFKDRIRDCATALGASVSEGGLGLRAEDGEIVGILSPNCMDYVTLVHSLLMIATPFALISSFSTPFELKHAIQLSRATRIFVDARLLPQLLPVAKQTGIPFKHIYILEGRVKGKKNLGDIIQDVGSKRIPHFPVRPASKDTLAYLIFSSGTSGPSKAVMITHGNIATASAQGLVVTKEVSQVYTPPPPKTPEGISVALAFLPLHHAYGLHQYCFRAFFSPVTCVLMPRWDITAALKAIPKYRITALPLIPSVVHQIVNHPGIDKVDFSSVQLIGSGAAYLPVDLATKIQALAPSDSVFTEGYGMSETAVAAITQPYPGTLGGRMKKVVGSTGVLLPGMEARIVREDGSDADFDEVGELLLRGGNIAPGYWNNVKATKDTFVDGWLWTGDKFRVDKEGYFFYADRAKDILKVSGIQVSPVDIENVLLAHPQNLIIDCTVAGVSGGRTSDEKVPRAWIVLSESGKKLGAAATIKELEGWHQENLSRYKWLRGGFEVVKQIPKSPTGKTLRRVLQDNYERKRAKKLKGKL